MKKWFNALATLMMVLFLAGNASAVTATNYSIDNILMTGSNFLKIEDPLAQKSLSGFFDFTYLGSEARDWNIAFKSYATGGIEKVLFSNGGPFVSKVGATVANLDVASLEFWDISKFGSSHALDTWSNSVHIYELLNDVMINGINLSAGMFLFGFNDGGTLDGDFDDMLVAAKPVPVPAAAWLLGSALLGLVGFRRTRTV